MIFHSRVVKRKSSQKQYSAADCRKGSKNTKQSVGMMEIIMMEIMTNRLSLFPSCRGHF